MTFPADQWADLFTTAELETLVAHWAVGRCGR